MKQFLVGNSSSLLKISVFWDMVLSSVVEKHEHLRWTYCLSHVCHIADVGSSIHSNILCRITFQETVIFSLSAESTILIALVSSAALKLKGSLSKCVSLSLLHTTIICSPKMLPKYVKWLLFRMSSYFILLLHEWFNPLKREIHPYNM